MSQERWLVTGASGQLGGYVVRRLGQQPGAAAVLALAGRGAVASPGVAVQRIDLRDESRLRMCVAQFRPTHVVHLAAMTGVGDAYAHPQEAELVNTWATQVLAEAAAECGARLVFSSTDMVFDGTAAPYREGDPTSPPSNYGRTKVAAEQALLEMEHAVVVRLPLMYGQPCTPRGTTFAKQIAALRRGEALRLFSDEFRTPMWLGDAARTVIGLALSGRNGLIHAAGPERLSRYELIEACCRPLGITGARLEAVSRLSIEAPEPRPADLSLNDDIFRHEFPHLASRPISALGPEALSTA